MFSSVIYSWNFLHIKYSVSVIVLINVLYLQFKVKFLKMGLMGAFGHLSWPWQCVMSIAPTTSSVY